MPGTFVFRPIEANLTHNTDLIGKMNPYCSFVVGGTRIKGEVCKKGGKHPHWNDAITVPMGNEPTVVIELMDKDKITHDDHIGSCLIDLMEVQAQGQVSRWYPLTHKNKPAGEILLEAVFQPDTSLTGQTSGLGTGMGVTSTGGMGMTQSGVLPQEQLNVNQAGFTQQEGIITQPDVYQQETVTTQAQVLPEQVSVSVNETRANTGHIYAEQRQSVEARTFLKEVDVVETRSLMKDIEVLEPRKVVKDVLVTEAVPVTKQIEVTRPEVVMKEIEVIEPRVVTKQIQVVENVPVMKHVEVIEPRTTIQEIETVEPQTFTKQIEVMENFPVRKQVEITEPYTVKKAVEFVEPVITTQTIVKETQQPVIVDERVTTTVGPATLVGEVRQTEYYTQGLTTQQGYITEEQRLAGQFGQTTISQQTGLQQGYQGHHIGGQSSILQDKEMIGPGALPSNYINPKP